MTEEQAATSSAEAEVPKATTTKKAPVKKKAAVKKAPAKKAAPKKAPAKTVKAAAPKKVSTKKANLKTEKSDSIMHLDGAYHYAVGKRKRAVARVRLYLKGSGKSFVNDRELKEYFPTDFAQQVIASPLKMTDMLKTFDITAKVVGGGPSSQSEAVRHGISKALLLHDPALRSVLKPAGYLTRDSRIKERKKYGLKRARRAPQFSKR
jgi:small subunit ribosomal protein S9